VRQGREQRRYVSLAKETTELVTRQNFLTEKVLVEGEKRSVSCQAASLDIFSCMTTRKQKTTTEKVKKFLTKTGFILEMEVAEILKKSGYEVKVNQYFLDLEEGKKREIDIVATKEINKINIVLIIECKQSLQDNWVFICSEKKPSRYYATVTHLPLVSNLHKSEIFNETHKLSRKIPLAQNYIVLDKHNERKSNSLQIEECIHKLPKAIIDIASKSSANKTIFIPVGIFNDQIFIASYENKLEVSEVSAVQYDILFESKFYKKKDVANRLAINSLHDPIYDESLYNFEAMKPSDRDITRIITTASKVMPRFQIDFVAKPEILDYLKILEDGIKTVSSRKWTYNLKK
jgi:hypothetical protein